ncbi:diphthine methyltransferase [Drosophila grimshawi]|uniref:methylated diphthine methylhydrolase n=1 Tax=Drosophila grimshawi TaxID=7222 RepID=B4JMZ4_DROGR|nr:diphthine methyltransferase [Drosophila grimshawi]EDV92087.1 GH24237 [Drosophila grimshawi]
MKFSTLHSVDTVYSADSVEWCTVDEAHNGYFACGTYQLVNAEQTAAEGGTQQQSQHSQQPRKGRVYLYAFDVQGGALHRLQCIETAAILDMKWLPAGNSESGPLLATVNGLGEVDIYELLAAEQRLMKRASLQLEQSEEEPILALAIDWRQCADDADVVQLLVSDSRGNIHQLQLHAAQQKLSQLRCWHAHNFEAWTCAFDRWSPQRLYTGGDDCLLHAYDLRIGDTDRIWTNRAHGAGVTSLLSRSVAEHQLLTGSYDEVLRLFDTRRMKCSLAELNLGGGIWRLKPHPLRNNLILTACMYNNFHVVDISSSGPGPGLNLVGTYGQEHESICYGADWAPNINSLGLAGGASAEIFHMATCSFYDNKLCVSSVQA